MVDDWYRRNRRYIWGSVATVGLGWLAYKAYYFDDESGSNDKPKSGIKGIQSALRKYTLAFMAASDIAELFSRDVQSFLSSPEDEIPISIKQLSKLMQSQEVQTAVQSLMTSALKGASAAIPMGNSSEPSLTNKIIDAVLSDRGQGLIGMAVDIATKNATSALVQACMSTSGSTLRTSTSPFSLQSLLELATTEPGERLLNLLLTKSIRTIVETAVSATAGYNAYNDALSAISQLEHRDAMTYILTHVTATFCKEVAMAVQQQVRSPGGVTASSSGSFEIENSKRPVDIRAHISANPQGDLSIAPARLSTDSQGSMAQSSVDQAARVTKRGALGQLGSSTSAARSTHTIRNVPKEGWVRQVSALAREADVRSLAVEFVSCATREATREALGIFVGGNAGEGMAPKTGVLAQANTFKIYTLLVILVVLFLYAVSPQRIAIYPGY